MTDISISGLVESLVNGPANAISLLTRIFSLVDTLWASLNASDLSVIEQIHEDEARNIEERQLSAMILSKTYYHLGDFSQSLHYALEAGSYINWTTTDEWIQVIKREAVTQYTAKPAAASHNLLQIINTIIDEALELGQETEALGVALLSQRIDVISRIIRSHSCQDKQKLLMMIYDGVTSISCEHSFTNQVLSLTAEELKTLGTPDAIIAALAMLIRLRDAKAISDLLALLEESKAGGGVKASATFLAAVLFLAEAAPSSLLSSLSLSYSPLLLSSMALEFMSRHNNLDPGVLMTTRATLSIKSSLHHSAMAIASGFAACGTTSDDHFRVSMDFITHATNWAKFTTVASLGVIHRGQNIETLLDVLHSYLPSTTSSSNSAFPYAEGGALYALGLALAAPVGCGYGKKGDDVLFQDLIIPHLSVNGESSEVKQHGAALAAGLLSLGVSDTIVVDPLKQLLFAASSAVVGEAAAIGFGLTQLASGCAETAAELLRFALSMPPSSCHDKIIRGIGISIAFILAGAGEFVAAPIIDEMSQASVHPELRAGAQLAIALAFTSPTGDASEEAIRRLLATIGSDANGEVRRSAAIALGFAFLSRPDRLLALADRLLASSYSPMVRFGIAIAIGITFSGTGNPIARRILSTFMTETVDFVRQGAFIAISLVMMNYRDARETSGYPHTVENIRKWLEKAAHARNEDPISKFGAIIGQGLIDAGGKNARIRLLTPIGERYWPGIAGAVLFAYYSWNWHPIAHMLALAIAPMSLIGIAERQETNSYSIPQFTALLNLKEDERTSPFYNISTSTKDKDNDETETSKSTAAVLSITAKTKARLAAKRALRGDMDIDGSKEKTEEIASPAHVPPEIIEMTRGEPSAAEASASALGSHVALPSVSPTSYDEAEAIASMQSLDKKAEHEQENMSEKQICSEANLSASVPIENFSRLIPCHAQAVRFEDPSTKTKLRFQPIISQNSRYYLSTLFTVLMDCNAELYGRSDLKSNASVKWIDDEFETSFTDQ